MVAAQHQVPRLIRQALASGAEVQATGHRPRRRVDDLENTVGDGDDPAAIGLDQVRLVHSGHVVVRAGICRCRGWRGPGWRGRGWRGGIARPRCGLWGPGGHCPGPRAARPGQQAPPHPNPPPATRTTAVSITKRNHPMTTPREEPPICVLRRGGRVGWLTVREWVICVLMRILEPHTVTAGARGSPETVDTLVGPILTHLGPTPADRLRKSASPVLISASSLRACAC